MAKIGKRPAQVLIGGRWRAAHGKATREIREPATGKLVGVAADCDAVDVDLAVKAARAAQVAWGKRPGLEKAVLMRQVGERIRHMGKDLATLMARETGKPLIEAMDCIEWVAGVWEYYAEVGRASRGNSICRWRRTSSTSPSRSRTAWWGPSSPSTSRCS
jgi:succinate-semialdehyde dehydrogenase/glutarate-semialdehyde dehydrogenase